MVSSYLLHYAYTQLWKGTEYEPTTIIARTDNDSKNWPLQQDSTITARMHPFAKLRHVHVMCCLIPSCLVGMCTLLIIIMLASIAFFNVDFQINYCASSGSSAHSFVQQVLPCINICIESPYNMALPSQIFLRAACWILASYSGLGLAFTWQSNLLISKLQQSQYYHRHIASSPDCVTMVCGAHLFVFDWDPLDWYDSCHTYPIMVNQVSFYKFLCFYPVSLWLGMYDADFALVTSHSQSMLYHLDVILDLAGLLFDVYRSAKQNLTQFEYNMLFLINWEQHRALRHHHRSILCLCQHKPALILTCTHSAGSLCCAADLKVKDPEIIMISHLEIYDSHSLFWSTQSVWFGWKCENLNDVAVMKGTVHCAAQWQLAVCWCRNCCTATCSAH